MRIAIMATNSHMESLMLAGNVVCFEVLLTQHDPYFGRAMRSQARLCKPEEVKLMFS